MASANLGFCTSLLVGSSPMSIKSLHSNLFFATSSLFFQEKKKIPISTLSSAVVCTASKPVTVVSEINTTKTRIPRGITKSKPISPAMQEFLGVTEIPRTQALKQIWAYIKQHNLQVCLAVLWYCFF